MAVSEKLSPAVDGTETHNWTLCREPETLEQPVLNEVSPSAPSLQGSGKFAEEVAVRTEDTKEATLCLPVTTGLVHM